MQIDKMENEVFTDGEKVEFVAYFSDIISSKVCSIIELAMKEGRSSNLAEELKYDVAEVRFLTFQGFDKKGFLQFSESVDEDIICKSEYGKIYQQALDMVIENEPPHISYARKMVEQLELIIAKTIVEDENVRKKLSEVTMLVSKQLFETLFKNSVIDYNVQERVDKLIAENWIYGNAYNKIVQAKLANTTIEW